jgi:hypothetical protein
LAHIDAFASRRIISPMRASFRDQGDGDWLDAALEDGAVVIASKLARS